MVMHFEFNWNKLNCYMKWFLLIFPYDFALCAALLDDMDPLAASKSSTTRKTPQSFLGENSALVNLDQLIKTSNPTTTTAAGQAAYNPFGDLSQPPKTNLFQQQMQPVCLTNPTDFMKTHHFWHMHICPHRFRPSINWSRVHFQFA